MGGIIQHWSERPGKARDLVAIGGIAWNVFGAVPFLRSVTASGEDLIASGMTAEQAAAMTGYPLWVTVAFGVGVVTGILGSLFLLLRRPHRTEILVASLLAYGLLWVGYAVYGVFAAFGAGQIAIMSTVVAIAAVLCIVSFYSGGVARAHSLNS